MNIEDAALVEALWFQLVSSHRPFLIVPGGGDKKTLVAGHDAIPVTLTGAFYVGPDTSNVMTCKRRDKILLNVFSFLSRLTIWPRVSGHLTSAPTRACWP